MTKKIPPSGTSPGMLLEISDKLDASKAITFILFAHGIGERGNDLANVENFLIGQTPNLVNFLNNGNFILAAPQLPSGSWSPSYFDFAYDYLSKNYSANPKVFITGVSWGGQEIWQWAALHNDKLLGVIACCCVNVTVDFCAIKTPVIAYHAKNDSQVPYAEGTVAISKINLCNPPQPAKLISYDTGDHYIWNTVYGEQAVKDFFSGVATPVPTTLKADASATITNVVGTKAVLDASKSTGVDESQWNAYEWSADGPVWNIFPGYIKYGKMLNIENLIPGLFNFKLTVRDGKGNISIDKVSMTVSLGKKIIGEVTIAGKTITIFDDNTWTYK
jgi:pimeloyl-ACP methyl ester carboxylesterase